MLTHTHTNVCARFISLLTVSDTCLWNSIISPTWERERGYASALSPRRLLWLHAQAKTDRQAGRQAVREGCRGPQGYSARHGPGPWELMKQSLPIISCSIHLTWWQTASRASRILPLWQPGPVPVPLIPHARKSGSGPGAGINSLLFPSNKELRSEGREKWGRNRFSKRVKKRIE